MTVTAAPLLAETPAPRPPPLRGPRASRIFRYGFAGIGSISTAGAQFVLSLQLLHVLTQAQFGGFSFLLVASQFSFSVSSALLCAPFPLFFSGPPDERKAAEKTFLSANLVLGLVAAVLFLGIGAVLGLPGEAALPFAAYGGLMLLRWFGRAYAYAHGQQWRTVVSDLTYGVVLLASVAITLVWRKPDLQFAYLELLLSAAVALVPLGRAYLLDQFAHVSFGALRRYGTIWRKHSMWSLLGVVTTEATANAHAYIVTLFAGPTAFAPLAASALLTRPMALARTALSDFERPQIARHLADGDVEQVRHATTTFRIALASVWLICAFAGVVLMIFRPHAIFPEHYHLGVIVIGIVLWFAITAIRLLRTPENVALQAAGQFRALANASLWSAGISVVAVTVLVLTTAPLWSILGILVGEIVFAVMVRRQSRRWLQSKMAAAETP